jgi:hypothetical protein
MPPILEYKIINASKFILDNDCLHLNYLAHDKIYCRIQLNPALIHTPQ